jgi:hypothetical protein
MLVRISDPDSRTNLWLWLHNSGLRSLATEGEDGVRVLAELNSRERLEKTLVLWETRNPGVHARIAEDE